MRNYHTSITIFNLTSPTSWVLYIYSARMIISEEVAIFNSLIFHKRANPIISLTRKLMDNRMVKLSVNSVIVSSYLGFTLKAKFSVLTFISTLSLYTAMNRISILVDKPGAVKLLSFFGYMTLRIVKYSVCGWI
jgi:hypothetical protein